LNVVNVAVQNVLCENVFLPKVVLLQFWHFFLFQSIQLIHW